MTAEPTNHRALHTLDATGRDPEIEDYVTQSVGWFVQQLLRNPGPLPGGTLLDIGSDTGFAAQLLANLLPDLSVLALEPNPGLGTPLYPLIQMPVDAWCDRHQNAGDYVQYAFMNHVLEHLETPLRTLGNLHRMGLRHLFVAVPDAEIAGADFVGADGHLHTFTDVWFDTIVPRSLPVHHRAATRRCFRRNYHELWFYFEFGERK